MNLTDYALRILSADTLEEKLQPFTDLEDGNRRSLRFPSVPTRPQNLQFSSAKPPKFPSVDQLERADMRGLVFHFFANHELLALELMAHTLLKFPNAPAEFRRGLAFIMKEEQDHLRLYIDRMAENGVSFGDFPVNDYFWRLIAPVQTLEKFTSYMSLTFEQANLDFSLYFLNAFKQLGDAHSEQTLETVYRDEIGHVKHGLTWARQWKKAKQSLWEFYTNELEFPMTPRRAKGHFFYEEARQAAGFDADFITELKLYSHSRGKTPNIFSFNGLAEFRFTNSNISDKHLALENDLAALPIFFASADDAVLTKRELSTPFRAHLVNSGIALPELLTAKKLRALGSRKLNQFIPWARSEHAIAQIAEEKLNFSKQNRAVESSYFEKSFGGKLRADFRDEFPRAFYGTCPQIVARSASDVQTALAQFGFPCVIKANLASAGNAMKVVTSETDNFAPWLERVFKTQSAVVVEPWLSRELDFSLQFERESTGAVRAKGAVLMRVSERGAFKGIRLGRLNTLLSHEHTAFLYAPLENTNVIKTLEANLCAFLEKHLANAPLYGAFGVDCLLFRNEENMLKLLPIVELNPRYTMGRFALELRKELDQNSSADWQVLTRSALKKASETSFSSFAEKMMAQHPIEKNGNRIAAGFLATSDFETAEQFFSYALITKK